MHSSHWQLQTRRKIKLVHNFHFQEELTSAKLCHYRKAQLVNWCFKPSQPLGIISGLKETFIKRHIVERTNKAEIRPEEQSEKTESCRENL